MEMSTIKVKHSWTKDPEEASTWLNNIKGPVACDFEVAVKYTKEAMESMKQEYELIKDDESKFDQAKSLYSKIKATGLSHPYYCIITHFSFAESEDEGKVIVLDNKNTARFVLRWLIETDVKQLWHNASFDFKHIQFHTGKFPKVYEDTQIASKCLMNHVEVYKANTGLKMLMGHHYGNWAVSADNFTLEQMYNEDLIAYAAVDACATYKLWTEIEQYTKVPHSE